MCVATAQLMVHLAMFVVWVVWLADKRERLASAGPGSNSDRWTQRFILHRTCLGRFCDVGFWLGVLLAAVFGLHTRYTDHLYQGGVRAWSVVVLGLLLLLIYGYYRTIWPVIVAHFAFDVWAGLPGLQSMPVQAGLLVGVLAVFAITIVVSRVNRGGEPDAATVPPNAATGRGEPAE